MPIETIKCQECGSADVTEFKPGSYVCGHCEAVFKHIDPSQSTSEVCSCGTFAIGRCYECSVAVCGLHSALWTDQRRLCSADWRARDAEAKQAIEARFAKERALQAAARGIWDTEVRELLAKEVPAARVCRVMRAATQPDDLGQQPYVRADLVIRLLPELFRAQQRYEPERPPWSDDEIALWFAKASRTSPGALIGAEYKTILGGYKRRRFEGWIFYAGSTSSRSPRDAKPSAYPAGVSSDGKRLLWGSGGCLGTASSADSYAPGHQGNHFNGTALGMMADLAELPSLPPEP
jgi:hypothetical protein